MEQDCVLCGPRPDLEMYLEKGNFFCAIPRGQIGPGHIMIVTKKHFDCYAAPDFSAEDEYYHYKERLADIITRHFSKPFQLEYGVWGQSVKKHAHTHVIPLKGPDYEVTSIFEEMVSPGNILVEEANFARLRQVFIQEKGYVWLEEHGISRILHTHGIPDDYSCTYLLYRYFFAVKKKVGVLAWDKMTEEQKKKDALNREETEEVLSSYQL